MEFFYLQHRLFLNRKNWWSELEITSVWRLKCDLLLEHFLPDMEQVLINNIKYYEEIFLTPRNFKVDIEDDGYKID